ncbi:MAG: hypothetical protein JWN38_924 [Candidatus Saccharibacteria bacterium]|nr:hypothetical protein [Candidatus Saccharibacteria bacterium]
MAASATNKDTIYIDIDEEITGIIDKVRASDGKVVALVLPKRASVLQSIVNMKLLKRSADQVKKNLVLITTESSLMPLAGAVGLYVAKTPQSKPEIPVSPHQDFDAEETVDEESVDLSDDALPIAAGAVAGAGLASAAGKDDVETVELDNDPPAIDGKKAAVAAPAAVKTPKAKKDKKLAVPNFERFRTLIIIGGVLLLVLIIGIVWAYNALPKAQINITTNASNVNASASLTLSTAAKSLDLDTSTVPAKVVSQLKTSSQTASASGQQNNGAKAQGTVNFTASSCSSELPADIPAFTGISSGGKTFITQEAAEFNVKIQNKKFICTTDDVNVTAQTGGASYNLPQDTSFTVANRDGVTGTATEDFNGGTDAIVKTVTQSDIDSAKQKLATSDSGIKNALRRQLEDANMYAITDTYAPGTPTLTESVDAGAVADTVTVTQTVTYTMFGVTQSDLNSVVDKDIKKQIDTSKQTILSRGLDNAQFNVTSNDGKTAQVGLTTVATAGPDLNVNDLKSQVAGKKGGDIKSLLQATPGVTNVNVKLSPFFVNSVPKKTSRITITIADPTPATNGTTDNVSN